MTQRLLLLLLLFWPGLALGQTITVDPGITYQTHVGWEYAILFDQRSDSTTPINVMSQFTSQFFDDAAALGWCRGKIVMGSGFENSAEHVLYAVINDNADPNVRNDAGFKWAHLDDLIDTWVLPMKSRCEASGRGFYLVFNHVQDDSTTVHNEGGPAFAEFGEAILAAFDHIHARYGWHPDAFEVTNEPVLFWTGPLITPNGTNVARLMLSAEARLTAAGYNPDYIMPSNTNPGFARTFYDEIQTVPGAAAVMDEISFHRYDTVLQKDLKYFASEAAAKGYGVGMLEFWNLANSYILLHEDLKVTNVTAWQKGILGDQFSVPGPIFHMTPSSYTLNPGTKLMSQYTRFIYPGAQRIEATSSDSNLDPLCYINPGGGYVVVVKAATGRSFTIGGLPAGEYAITYTTDSVYDVDRPNQIIAAGENVSTRIPARGALTV